MKYELVTIDCGHEYTEPCNILYEGDQIYVVRKENGNEIPVRKGSALFFVREVKPKVDLNELVIHAMKLANEEGAYSVIYTNAWLTIFLDKLIEAGALKEGEYEIPN